jgi:sialate O-acetylesterase
VLQRDMDARVWGTAAPATTVSIVVRVGSSPPEHALSIATDASGKWEIDIPKRPASTTPHNVTLTCGTETVTMTDVLFGDVFGCHGQSNMQFGLSDDMNASTSCAKVQNYPLIRFIDYASNEDWNLPTAATACEPGRFQAFSAVCWYFGRAMYDRLNAQHPGTVPVGLVGAQVGGTPVEAWSGPDARAQCNQTDVVDRVGTYWTSMIEPILPMALSGQVWCEYVS